MKLLQRCVREPGRAVGRLVGALAAVALLGLSACAETPRTATNFCRVLADRIDDITTPPTSNDDVQRLIDHYERLAEVAPLEVQDDLVTIRDLFITASRVDTDDEASVQQVADAAYAAERAAQDAGIYVGATCGVDISTGLTLGSWSSATP